MWDIERVQKEFGYDEESAIRFMIRALVNWAQNDAPKTFDNFIIDDLSIRVFQGNKPLTYSQKRALNNISNSFCVDLEKWAIDKIAIE